MNTNTRRVSNKKSIICLSIGIILILLSLFGVTVIVLNGALKWNAIGTLLVSLGVVGGIITVFSIISLLGISSLNKMLESPDYGMDYPKELSTHKIVGMKKAKERDGAEKFNKYSEWKNHIEKEHSMLINNDDAYHFFVRRLRNRISYKEFMLAVAVPAELVVFSTYYNFDNGDLDVANIIAMIISMLFLIIVLARDYMVCEDEINFIKDCMEVLFDKR